MRVIAHIEVSAVQDHLRQQATGVSLNIEDMPGPAADYKAYRVILDSGDASRIVLWWEFQKHTKEHSCRLTDLLESAATLKKAQPFIHGDRSRGFLPGDLRTLPNREITILTNDLASDFLYLIDGNNRLVGHFLLHKTIQDVPAVVCAHPKLMEWAYVPIYYKRRNAGQSLT